MPTIIIILGILVALLLFLRIYTKLTMGWDRSFTCLVGKTAIVTGSNTGIGYYTAMDFAKRGGRVILACRNKEKAEKARDSIIKITGNPNVVVKLFDSSSYASVRAFAKEVNETEERLDILVNNAGIAGLRGAISEDGCNCLMQVNYYSSFLLTHLLIDKLKASAPSRVINVSSVMHKLGRIDPENLDKYPSDSMIPEYINYSNSKLCNVCFTVELARRLDGTGVTTNSLHPGAISSDIWRKFKGAKRAIISFFTHITFKTPLEGAQTTIYLSVSPEVRHISGQYFVDCQEANVSQEFTEHKFVKKIWESTEKLVKLAPEEKIN